MAHRLLLALLAASLAACRASSSAPPSTAPFPAIAPGHEEIVYAPPADLKWGQSPDEAKRSLLANGFTFHGQRQLEEGSVKQKYQGTFLGFAANSVTATFRDGGLKAVILMLPEIDPRPATQRWQAMVDAMQRSRGAPSRLSPVSKIGSPTGPGGYAALDQKIRDGVASPSATWISRNTVVTISISEDVGTRALRPAWAFFGPGAFQIQRQHQDAVIEANGEE